MSTKNKNNYRGLKCLNCNFPLDISDKYCSNCGQKNTTKRLSLKDFFNEFLSNFYAYDSKILNSIKSLFTSPGKAAKEYIDGKRMYFANPFRLYLSISLLFFVFEGVLDKFQSDFENPNRKALNISINDSIQKKEKDSIIKTIDSISLLNKKPHIFTSIKEINKKNVFSRNITKLEDYIEFYKKNQTLSIDSALTVLKHQKTNWNRFLYKKAIDSSLIFEEEKSLKNNSFYDYILAKLPFILFISLPFLTLCFLLIYIRSNLNYAEHMVFVFNLMTFVFLLLILEKIFQLIGFNGFGLIVVLALPLYFYKSLRNFYQQSRWKTIIKFVILTFMLSIMSLIVTVLMFLIMFIIY